MFSGTALALVAGCSSNTTRAPSPINTAIDWNSAKLKPGMTKAELISILGTPKEVRSEGAQDDFELWIYPAGVVAFSPTAGVKGWAEKPEGISNQLPL